MGTQTVNYRDYINSRGAQLLASGKDAAQWGDLYTGEGADPSNPSYLAPYLPGDASGAAYNKYGDAAISDPNIKKQLATELVHGGTWDNIANQFPNLSPDQILNHFQNKGSWDVQTRDDGGFGQQLMDFAGPGSPLAWVASMALGGPVAGSISAANGSGATSSLGVDPKLTTLGALAYGASNSGGGLGSTPNDAVAGSEYGVTGGSAPNTNYWDNTYAANNTGTMTDASPAGGNMGEWTLDDSGNWVNSAGWQDTPTGAFDMGGSTTGATGPGTNPGDTIFGGSASNPYPGPDLIQQAGEYAKKYGGTVMQALAILSRGAPGLAGAVAANRQAGSLSALSDKYMAMGAPSRARYEASFDPNFTMMNDPGYKDALDQTAKATLHGMSVGGNPAGSPNAWAQTLSDVNSKFAYPALQNYRTGNASAGGLAAFNAAAPGAAAGAIDARGNVLNSAGAAVNDIFNPRQTLAQSMAEYQRLMRQGAA